MLRFRRPNGDPPVLTVRRYFFYWARNALVSGFIALMSGPHHKEH